LDLFDRPLEHHPLVLFAAVLVVQGIGAYLGHVLGKRANVFAGSERDLNTILGATMTLLALIIGFTFAMALNRYDQRKDLEVAEATAISAEIARVDLLPTLASSQARELLSRYLQQRILFYQVDGPAQLEQIRAQTEQLRAALWSTITRVVSSARDPVTALAVSGMNNVLDSETQADAAWRFHIPVAVWLLMLLIAFAGNLLLGLSEKRKHAAILLILPVVVSIPFYLIADIDSPRGGPIRVVPVNLTHIMSPSR
jgi:hypothetical protein